MYTAFSEEVEVSVGLKWQGQTISEKVEKNVGTYTKINIDKDKVFLI